MYLMIYKVKIYPACLEISFPQMTPLHVAAQRGDRISIVKYFLDQKADINIKDDNRVSETT